MFYLNYFNGAEFMPKADMGTLLIVIDDNWGPFLDALQNGDNAGAMSATGQMLGAVVGTKGVSFAFFLEQPCHVAQTLN